MALADTHCIPHSSIVSALYQVSEIQAKLPGDNGIANAKIKHANLVSFHASIPAQVKR